jgi:8-oxo-dGTP diphosphatase
MKKFVKEQKLKMKIMNLNQSNWTKATKVLDVNVDIIKINQGEFQNLSGSSLTKGWTYIFRIEGNKILETGMSTVDMVISVPNEGGVKNGCKILLIKRGRPPFVGMWATPGGNIDEGEEPQDAVIRELEEETGLILEQTDIKFVGVFDKPYRDPRNKNCISYAFAIKLDSTQNVTAGDDATECEWLEFNKFGETNVEMAFDHNEIIKEALNILQ